MSQTLHMETQKHLLMVSRLSLHACTIPEPTGGARRVRVVLKRHRWLSLKCVGSPTLAPDELWRQLHTQRPTERKTHTRTHTHGRERGRHIHTHTHRGLTILTTACRAHLSSQSLKHINDPLCFSPLQAQVKGQKRWVCACKNLYI